MDATKIPDEAAEKFKNAIERFNEELKKIRTGRAHPSMVEGVIAEAYGTPMPLKALATITTPEPQLIQISPFDPSNLSAITTAIRENQALGLNPSDDGRIIRVQIPPLTEERRREIAKQLGEKVEDAMIAMRQARHDARDRLDQAKKDKQITEDDVVSLQKALDDNMNKAKVEVDALAKSKEEEILKV